MRTTLLSAGLASQRARRFAEAEHCYKLVLAQSPTDAEALYRMGVLALQCANASGAVQYLRRASALQAFDADAWFNLGMAHVLDYGMTDAEAAFERALAMDAAHASAAVALGNVYKLVGRHIAAADAYRRAVASPQTGPTLFSQLLIGLHTNPAVTPAELFTLHCEWARRYAVPLYPRTAEFGNDRDPNRRLRVGMVSPKFTADIVGHFVRSIVPPLAASVDLYLYHAGSTRDWVTEELARPPATWRDIAALDDAAAHSRIVADRIDVLVDLAGHTPGNRLLLFARRPAPVQVTWLDYFDTTGIATMDVIVTDPVTTPEALLARGAQRFVEQVAYVPHTRLVYSPPPFAPDVAPTPALRNGYVTFGCFGRVDKILPDVVAVWGRVLEAVPGSRLVLKNLGYDVEPVQTRITNAFTARGVGGERVTFRGASAHAEMLGEHALVDIALDTFPYTGGATTCDALWMGVPVVTLAGETMIARQGASLLRAAGLGQCVASDADGYVEAAVSLAQNLPALAALRADMRARVTASPLCDAPGFATAFLDVLAAAWRRWCESAALEADAALAGRDA
ncbi:MAG: tetratricopeptide repeat protein [Casimicrobiaceae bacterium]